MAAHLRFNAKTGMVEARTPYGEHTKELLQLNENTLVQYRLSTLRIVRCLSDEIDRLDLQVKALAGLLRADTISQAQYEEQEQDVNQDLDKLLHTLHALTGQQPLPPLRKKLLGITLI